MEIDKLFTLSQFIDYIDQMPISIFKKYLGMNEKDHLSDPDEYFQSYEVIARYNNFLKQPPKKEMFVSPCNTLMFKGFSICESNIDYHNKGLKTNAIYPYGNGFAFMTLPKHNTYNSLCCHYQILTLFDLAQATNGTLELNNVKI